MDGVSREIIVCFLYCFLMPMGDEEKREKDTVSRTMQG